MMHRISIFIDKYKHLPVEIKASFWFLVCAFFQKGISVISTPIFTRIMTIEQYGEFNVFSSWHGIVSVIVTLNLFFGVYVRGLVEYSEDKERFTSSLQGLMLVMIVIWTCIYWGFKDFFNALFSLSTLQMISMLMIIWTNGVFTFWATEKRVALSYRSLVVVSMISSIIMPVMEVAFVLNMNDRATARVLGRTCASLIMYPPLFVSQIVRGKKVFVGKYWKYALAFNVPLLPHYLSQIVLSSSDRIMIERICGRSQAGIYSLAYSISQIMTVFSTALMQTIEPWMYRKIKEDKPEEIPRIAYITITIVAIINLVLIVLAPEVITIFAPKSYLEAIWVVPPVAMSNYFMFCYTFFAVFEFYYKKTQYITLATVIGAIVNIGLNMLCIAQFGYVAAGYTTLICYVIYALFHLIFMQCLIKKNFANRKIYDYRMLFIITAIFLVSGFLMMYTYKYIIIRYLVVVILLIIGIINRARIANTIKSLLRLKKG